MQRRKASLSDARRALLLKRLQGKKTGDSGGKTIEKKPQDGLLPLSYAQQRVWFLQQLHPQNRAYNMSEAWRIKGPLDIEALQKAMRHVVRRHASLRTRFAVLDEEPWQLVEQAVEIDLSLTDISNLPRSERENELLELVVRQGSHDFDLQHAPLFRPFLIRLGEDEHILQLVLHHIITDEWSNDVLWRELNYYYEKSQKGEAGELPVTAVEYSDYAHWQREQVNSGALDQQKDYWRDQLGGHRPLLQLPIDRQRPPEQSLRGGLVRRTLPAGLLNDLQHLSKEAGTTIFTTLLAAYQVLLYRYSAQEDILVGTAIANRQRAETTEVIGMFVNTAVIRAQLSGELSFRRLLAQVRQTVLDALANQDLPFDVLVQKLHPQRTLSYNPLFQTMFVFRADDTRRGLPGMVFEPVRIDRGVSKFDLTLFAGEEDGRLMSAFEYSSDLFDEMTVVRMLDHWQTLLAAIAANPDEPIQKLALMSAAEKEQVLKEWNQTAVPVPDERPLHKIIADVARQHPHQLAVVAENGRLTYGELDRRANDLALLLVERGLQPGTPVGLFVERSLEMVVGILGILKAGGAYVPLAPEYPHERIDFVIQETGAPLIVTQSHLAERLTRSEGHLIELDCGEPASELTSANSTFETTVSLDDLAYIIYTSGSTGSPKGVMVTHRNLLASTFARDAYYGAPVKRFLLLSSFAFDSSVAGIFWTLMSGGTLVLPEPDGEKDVLKLARIIYREKVTHTLALPTLYRFLLKYAPAQNLQSLKIVVVAGEACPPDLGPLHYRILPDCRLVNEYGPTEATVWCTVFEVPPASADDLVPIGRPIANSKLFILDKMRQPVPVGVAGELYVAGMGITRGYWNNPELSAGAFLSLDLGLWGRLSPVYRTGDLARWRADGQVEFLGRIDNQVKIRGYRIEPGEIESHLICHPSVAEAVVRIWEAADLGPGSDKSLVAYVVQNSSSQGEAVDGIMLRNSLAELLPDFMVPDQILVLETFPRTPNGKIDRGRLPKPSRQMDGERTFALPRSRSEKILARIWSDILKIDQISVEDKFFELGGDSLMSIQVIARARQEGLRLTPRQLFKEQTISRLAAVAKAELNPEADYVNTDGPLPLTPIQHWFLAQELSDPSHWNQAAWFELAPDVDINHLDAALATVVERHSMLRARFRQVNGVWQQEIQPIAPTGPVKLVSLVGKPADLQEAEMMDHANRLHAALDISSGPLIKTALFLLGEAIRPRLLITIHHLVVDAISWGVITADLAAAYSRSASGDPQALPAQSPEYAIWSRALQAYAREDDTVGEVDYWLPAVSSQPALPRDTSPTGRNTEGNSQLITVSLDRATTDLLLREANNAYHTRTDDLLLTALARAMAAWTGNSALSVSLERHGREEIDPRFDFSQTVGWFTSLFPITLRVDDLDDVGANLRAIKEQLRAVPRNGIGFGVLRYLGEDPVRKRMAALPQPEILFNYLGQAPGQADESSWLRPIVADTGRTYGEQNERAHLIDVNARVVDGRLLLKWQYATSFFSEDAIERLARAYVNELRLLVDHCMASEQDRHTPSDFPLAELKQDDLDALSDLLSQLD